MHANSVAVQHMVHGENRQGVLAGVDKTVDGQGEQQGERQGKQEGLQGEPCLLPLCLFPLSPTNMGSSASPTISTSSQNSIWETYTHTSHNVLEHAGVNKKSAPPLHKSAQTGRPNRRRVLLESERSISEGEMGSFFLHVQGQQ